MAARKGVAGLHALSSHGVVCVDVEAEVAGVLPLDDVAVLQRIARATIVGAPAVHLVDPAGELSAVELIEVVDALDVGAVLHGRVDELHVDALLLAGPPQDVEDALAL